MPMSMLHEQNPQGSQTHATARGRLLFRIVLSAWILLCLGICIRAAIWPHRNAVYPAFSDAGRCWVQSADNYDTHFWALGIDQFRYAPIVTVFFVPFGLLPDSLGGVLWRLINTAVLFAGVVVYCRATWPGPNRIGLGAAAAIGALLMPLSLSSLQNGQANPLVIGMLLLAVAATLHGRWNWAALMLAAPIYFKIYPVAVALLLLLIYPRTLGWRLFALMVLGILLPFAAQDIGYVSRQYDQWIGRLLHDDRSVNVFADSYRDLWLLLRIAGLPISRASYLLLQAVAAAAIAGIIVVGRCRRWPTRELLHTALDLGCCWMVLLGPATENCTVILIAPTFALAVWQAFAEPRPLWTRVLLAGIVCIFVASAVITSLPGGRNWAYPLNPLATLLLAVERVLHLDTATVRMLHATDIWSEPAQAA